jgi:hypothetical protein
VLIEELYYLVEVFKASYTVILTVSVVLHYASESEVVSDFFEEFFISFVLNDSELRKHLPAKSHLRHLVDAYMEATFCICEVDYPIRI